ncbi:MAG: sialate O-acetylesterase [bacterium]
MMNKGFKITGLVIIGIGIILSFYAGPKVYRKYNSYKVNKEWRVNFPKTISYVDKLPNPDSLYIFIMAGQSNMAGRGFVEPQDTLPYKRILTIDKSMKWIYAKEPLHFYEPSMTGLDCGMSFAKKLLDSIPEGISIAVSPCAVGGSSIEQWINNETFRGVTLLDNFKDKVGFAKDYGIIKGIIWHQGESNAKSELIPKYSQRLDSLINTFRFLVKNDTLPIILGELGSYSKPTEKQMRWDSINTMIQNIAWKDKNIDLVETGDLKHKGDNVHFDSESQRILGERYAKKYLEITMPAHNNVYTK